MIAVLGSGAVAGFVLFALQHFTVAPLIQAAETYEVLSLRAGPHEHEDEGWRPKDGWERTSLTAVSTVLTSVAFAAILFGTMAFVGQTIDAKRGAVWGVAAFACFSLAPAFGLPPQPPGAATADLLQRQTWWTATVIATAAGLWLVKGRWRHWVIKACGVALVLAPHVIGAPAARGDSDVPPELIRRFAIVSIATTGVFWLLVGALGGWIYSRQPSDDPDTQNRARRLHKYE